MSNFWGGSTYAEERKKVYKGVIDEVTELLYVTSRLDEQMEELRLDYDAMEKNPDSAEGKLSTTFIEKESISRQDMEALYRDLSMAIAEVKKKLGVAWQQYDFYCKEVEREKERERERARQMEERDDRF